jgi:hypothetical protein
MLQARKSRVRFPMRSLNFFDWPNLSSLIMALGTTQPLTEMITRNLPGGKRRPARKADVTANSEPIVEKVWEPRRLTTLLAFAACYRDTFTIIEFHNGSHFLSAICAERVGWIIRSSDLYSVGAQFGSRPGHERCWLRFFMFLIGLPRQMPGYCIVACCILLRFVYRAIAY